MKSVIQILKILIIVISCHMITLFLPIYGHLKQIETNLIVLLLKVFYGLNAIKDLNIVNLIVVNIINVVIMLYLIIVIMMSIKSTNRNAKDLVNSALINYHLIVIKNSVAICVLVIVELLRIVLIKKLMELGIEQYVKK